jgi:hypothetical protein
MNARLHGRAATSARTETEVECRQGALQASSAPLAPIGSIFPLDGRAEQTLCTPLWCLMTI